VLKNGIFVWVWEVKGAVATSTWRVRWNGASENERNRQAYLDSNDSVVQFDPKNLVGGIKNIVENVNLGGGGEGGKRRTATKKKTKKDLGKRRKNCLKKNLSQNTGCREKYQRKLSLWADSRPLKQKLNFSEPLSCERETRENRDGGSQAKFNVEKGAHPHDDGQTRSGSDQHPRGKPCMGLGKETFMSRALHPWKGPAFWMKRVQIKGFP